MRKAKPSARPQAASSPPPTSGGLGSNQNNSSAPPGASSYSSLVTPPVSSGQTKRDIVHPFKYSRDEMLQVWKDGGGSSTLPIEVERWEGIVREVAGDPVCLREFSETEKKVRLEFFEKKFCQRHCHSTLITQTFPQPSFMLRR